MFVQLLLSSPITVTVARPSTTSLNLSTRDALSIPNLSTSTIRPATFSFFRRARSLLADRGVTFFFVISLLQVAELCI